MKTLAKPTDVFTRALYTPVQSGLAVSILFASCVAGFAVLKFAPQSREGEIFTLAAGAPPGSKHIALPPPPQSSMAATDNTGANLPPLGEYYVGVWVDSIDPALASQLKLEKGIVVRYIVPGSPAETAGLKPNDLLLTACDEPLTQPCGLGFAVNKAKGTELAIEVLREGTTMKVALTPAKRPAKMWTPPEAETADTGDSNSLPPGAATAMDIATRERLHKAIAKLEAELAQAREEVKSLKTKLAEQEKDK